MSEDVPPYGSQLMSYVFSCPHCRSDTVTIDYADLRPVSPGVLGLDWHCEACHGWALVREFDRGLTVEKGATSAVRR
jgi:hypothetical protein